MFSEAKHHVIYAISNAPIREVPYPHFLSDRIFPEEFYREMLAHLPEKDVFSSILDTSRIIDDREDSPYKNRQMINLSKDVITGFAEKDQPFWRNILKFFKSADFIRSILWKFEPYLKQRYPSGLETVEFRADIQLVRDSGGYHLGPHADTPKKVAVVLFYLPKTGDNPDLGTSIYVPKQEGFTCNSGQHHPPEDFHRVFTTPYLPNTALGFFKTLNSFHGVEPLSGKNIQRDLIQFSIRQV